MSNPNPANQFVKNDPRINRKGRPKSFDSLRKLAVQIAGEQAGETELTRVQLMLKAMASSKNPRDRELFLAYAYGKPKEQVDITSDGKAITFFIERDDEQENQVTPGAV